MSWNTRILSFAVVIVLLGGSVWGLGLATDVSSLPAQSTVELAGDGTEQNPYVVTDVDELQSVTSDRSAHYELEADVDASELAESFDPIGDESAPFTGSFDGNGHTITGVTVDEPTDRNVGLFGVVEDGVIEDVRLERVDVTGDERVGALVGLNAGEVRAASASGTVTGTNDVGGLVGVASGDVTESAADVTVDGSSVVGGLVGFNECGPISDSWASGDVVGDEEVGGLVGENHCTITRSYAVGEVSGATDVGGAIGTHVSGSVADTYWDVETTGHSDSAAGTGLTTDELRGQNAAELDGFDFQTTWQTTDDYPILEWQDDTRSDDGELDIEIDGNVPQDLDGDGLYEDVNGDGEFSLTDVVVLFEHLEEPVVTENVAAFDFAGTGDVSVTDVVALFESL
ncbi:dockerin type I domain-containing protein [Halobacteria archaeon AArc-m2/3/4]|uniref:Dockerin type I domain-containing protein n=1 Tax=Natronoglomus mannanivorans TaxID=2979990 RepID=A0ABT2QE91_9EURY|nr:dockerin type I domain-containing protein [Halobacteria archaeon AArc-m2/3/4]